MTDISPTDGVRELTTADLDRLAPVYLPLYATDQRDPAVIKQAYDQNFPQLFLDPLDASRHSPSLVYEERGEIQGMVAVANRLFLFRGVPVTAAVTTVLVATEQGSRSLAGVRLLRAVFEGPQDFTFTDQSNKAGRRAMQAAGATSIPTYSLRWEKRLRPSAAFASRIAKRLPSRLAPELQVVVGVTDRYAHHLPGRVRRHAVASVPEPPTGLECSPLTVEDVVAHGPGLLASFDLHPDVSDPTIVQRQWNLLDIGHSRDRLAKVAVRNRSGTMIGWYIIHVDAVGSGEVLQIVADEKAFERVLTLAFHNARDMGALVIRGDVLPHQIFALGDLGCSFQKPRATSVQSTNRDLVSAFLCSAAFISGLEGEGFLDPAYTVANGR